jgi:hypothetical protein
MGPPHELVLALRDAYRATTFFETGTYEAHTTRWAARCFTSVITVEASPELHAAAKAYGSHLANVEFIRGDSRTVIRSRIANLPRPAIFWLDAHWSGGLTHGEADECPLIGELAELCDSGRDDFILIDDARLFLAPPPPPHRSEQWPSIDVILQTLQGGRRPTIAAIIDDVIVVVPPRARPVLASFAAREGVQYTPLERIASAAGANG